MGGGSSKTTVGYKYFFGLHLVLAQNPLRVMEIKLQEKTAWTGDVDNGQIRIKQEELFGESEGGFEGTIDVLGGREGQTPNDYLQSVLGAAIPAFRNVCSLVFRRPYMGNNPYPKGIHVKVQDDKIHNRWYPEKSLIIAKPDETFGPPVPSEDDDLIVDYLTGEEFSDNSVFSPPWADMNPAHIVWHVLRSVDTGGYGAAPIGASFTAAADKLYEEQLGLSFHWKNSDSRREFLETIEKHVDGTVYLDRLTGAWEFKLIRDDYEVADLPVFDKSNVTEWGSDISRENQAELPNQVTVTFKKKIDGSEGSVTVTNTASVRQMGRIRPRKINYEGIYRRKLATQIAQRDLQALSLPKWSGTIKVVGAPADLSIGSPFVISNPEFGMPNIVARVVERTDFDEKNTEVTLKFLQDRFSLSDDILVEQNEITEDFYTPIAAIDVFLEEAPYYLLVQDTSQSEVDSTLANRPDGGFLHTTAKRPNSYHLYTTLWTDPGPGFSKHGRVEFCPTAVLAADVSYVATDNSFQILALEKSDKIRVGSVAKIDDEYLRVDALSIVDGVSYLTFGRGCLDTAPQNHAAGAIIYFFQDFSGTDFQEYTQGDSVGVKHQTHTISGKLPRASTPVDYLSFDSRAIRPHPPGRLQIDGSYHPTSHLQDVPHVLSWAHRDREFQTTPSVEDFTYGDVGPETGVSYVVEVWDVPEDDASQHAGELWRIHDIQGTLAQEVTVGAVNSWDFANSDVFGSSQVVRLRVRAERDGYVCWTSPSIVATGTALTGYGLNYGFDYGGA